MVARLTRAVRSLPVKPQVILVSTALIATFIGAGATSSPASASNAGTGVASLSVTKQVSSAAFGPTLSIALTTDKATAIPGDKVTEIAHVTNTGATVTINGSFAGRVTEVNFRGDVFPAGSRSAPGRVRNEFTGNDFRAAELSGVAFLGGIDLSAQELPDGPRYALIRHARQRVAAVREQVNQWPAGPDQAAAVKYLDFYSGRGYELQEDIFLERDLLSRLVPPEIRQRILALLLADPQH